jgi:hypothetical protein
MSDTTAFWIPGCNPWITFREAMLKSLRGEFTKASSRGAFLWHMQSKLELWEVQFGLRGVFEYQVNRFGSYGELRRDSSIESVYLCVQNEWPRRASGRGTGLANHQPRFSLSESLMACDPLDATITFRPM